MRAGTNKLSELLVAGESLKAIRYLDSLPPGDAWRALLAAMTDNERICDDREFERLAEGVYLGPWRVQR